MKKYIFILFLFLNFSCGAQTEEKPIVEKIAVKKLELNQIQLVGERSFEVPTTINKTLKINFLLDTGCEESSIPFYIAFTLIENGTITEKDFLKDRNYRLADGSITVCKRLTLKTLTIGNITVENVVVSVSQSANAPLLLGQNVLREVSPISIDYKSKILTINAN